MRRIGLFLLALLLTGNVSAQAYQWQVDPIHTNFYFEIRHTYAAVRGQFNEFTARVDFDPDKPETARFEFEIRVDSIDTNNGKRDTHLRSDDFFAASTYPTIRFVSSKVSKSGDTTYLVEGKLTIKDVSREVVLPFVYHGTKANPLKKGELIAGMDARLSLDRLAWHVGSGQFAAMGVVGKDLDILLTVEMGRPE
ncbi:MAG: YceI family protein [Thermodesulfobacteriota bacterium]